MKRLISIFYMLTLLVAISCMNDTSISEKLTMQNLPTKASASNENGIASARPVYYDDELFTVNMKELSEKASEKIIKNTSSFEEIYAYNDLDDPQDFLSIISAVPGSDEGFSPLWKQFLIVFNDGFVPHQFTSEEDVEAAAEGSNPEITLVDTGEIYRCSVIGAP